LTSPTSPRARSYPDFEKEEFPEVRAERS
jgi:hypothetical protein